MPKVIELTVELDIQRVSCPGVWLCQDGRVSLTVFALGTSYQTCMLPPIFPLVYKDIFYYRKRFQETCALNNICCLLKDETIYCELVQWCDDCISGECTILAQYLGALNDVLFPSNMCSNEGVDLLMRRSKEFPGILSPKIEIATKVRIDELFNQPCNTVSKSIKIKACSCKRPEPDPGRQKQVCHTPMYHRVRCTKRTPSLSRSRSRSRSDDGSRSCCSLKLKEPEPVCPTGICNSNKNQTRTSEINLLNSSMPEVQRLLLESQFIDQEKQECKPTFRQRSNKFRIKPCVCEICKRYHELFHSNCVKS